LRDAFDDALRQVYVAADAALGRILDAAATPEVMVYSVHGMGANASRIDILDEMLARVLAGGDHRGAARSGRRRLAGACGPSYRPTCATARSRACRWRCRIA
jgi:hypothetical protein